MALTVELNWDDKESIIISVHSRWNGDRRQWEHYSFYTLQMWFTASRENLFLKRWTRV